MDERDLAEEGDAVVQAVDCKRGRGNLEDRELELKRKSVAHLGSAVRERLRLSMTQRFGPRNLRGRSGVDLASNHHTYEELELS